MLRSREDYSSSELYCIVFVKNMREDGNVVSGEDSCLRVLTSVCKGHRHGVCLCSQ